MSQLDATALPIVAALVYLAITRGVPRHALTDALFAVRRWRARWR